jgi:hypothetical protein
MKVIVNYKQGIMKNIFVSFVLSSLLVLSIQAQHAYIPMLKSGNQWNVKVTGNFPLNYRTFIYKTDIDTIIGGETCKKIVHTDDSSANAMFQFACYMFEDTNSQCIYLLDNQFNQKLYFDFKAQTEDTLILFTPIFLSLNQGDTFYVSQVDEEQISGITRNRISLKYKLDNNDLIDGEKWYEGLGTKQGIKEGAQHSIVGTSSTLLCFKNGGNLLYSSAPLCFYTNLGIEESAKIRFNVYPNPAITQVQFSFFNLKTNASLQIYNMMGALIETITISKETGEIILNVEHYKAGIYFARFENGDGSAETCKFLVSR